MKRIIIFLILGIFFSLSSVVKSDEMVSIEEYLSDKSNNDTAATIYSLVRCSGLELFFATILLEKAPDVSQLSKEKSGEFALYASKMDSATSDRKFDDSAKNMINSSQEIMNYYIIDGKKNWSKTGSYFLNSYIDKDRQLCDYLYNNVIKTSG